MHPARTTLPLYSLLHNVHMRAPCLHMHPSSRNRPARKVRKERI
jgi:hypothetical protein